MLHKISVLSLHGFDPHSSFWDPQKWHANRDIPLFYIVFLSLIAGTSYGGAKLIVHYTESHSDVMLASEMVCISFVMLQLSLLLFCQGIALVWAHNKSDLAVCTKSFLPVWTFPQGQQEDVKIRMDNKPILCYTAGCLLMVVFSLYILISKVDPNVSTNQFQVTFAIGFGFFYLAF